MKAIFVGSPATKLIINLFYNEVDLKISKKLKILGSADTSISYPLKKIDRCSDAVNGIYPKGLFADEFFPVKLACPNSKSSTFLMKK